uniref:Endonuclease domain-containing 1 protein-like n=1 Tax=Calidris pygmaea TaxID=425635 RepID=A0A8C3J6J9_9CHAR
MELHNSVFWRSYINPPRSQPVSGCREVFETPLPLWGCQRNLFSSLLLKLIGSKYSNTMETEIDLMNQTKVTIEEIKKSQAISQDYTNLKDLNRGHLNPRCHQYDNDSMKATFTLTNIVPQNEKLNGGEWNKYEVETMANMSKGCITTYVVVGAVPGNNFISGNRVNVPSYIWAGACCEISNQPSRAWAVIVKNDNVNVENIKLGELEKKLTDLYGKGQVSLFHGDCPRQ